jgi:phosphoribosylformylglycinamidine synthase
MSGFLAHVYVTLKPTVNDPQGRTIQGALHSLGFPGVKSVRAGKYLQIHVAEIDEAKAHEQIRGMCDRLLANPVIENYRFDLSPSEAEQ